jgi:lysine-specific demethylase 8
MEDIRSLLREACRVSGEASSRSGFTILLEQGLSLDAFSSEAKDLADLLRDRADEELRNHAFHSVPLYIRQRYELASLFQALLHWERDPNLSTDTALDCIKVLDMALLMTGCPMFRPKILSIIESLHSKLPMLSIPSLEPYLPMDVPQIMHPISELHQPSFSEFENHLKAQTPVIIKGMTEGWPCLSSRPWKDLNYFSKLCGHRTVPVEIGSAYTDDDWTQKLLPFHQVLQDILTKDSKTYLAQFDLLEHVPELGRDILVPDFCYLTDRDPILHIWLGPRGTVSPCHHDPYENIFAQVVGFKYIRLYSPEQNMYPYGEGSMLSNSSQVTR